MKQFSIRDLLFLVVIVALAVGWWFDRRPAPQRFAIAGTNDTICVLDTATGQAWTQSFTFAINPGISDIHPPKIPK